MITTNQLSSSSSLDGPKKNSSTSNSKISTTQSLVSLLQTFNCRIRELEFEKVSSLSKELDIWADSLAGHLPSSSEAVAVEKSNLFNEVIRFILVPKILASQKLCMLLTKLLLNMEEYKEAQKWISIQTTAFRHENLYWHQDMFHMSRRYLNDPRGTYESRQYLMEQMCIHFIYFLHGKLCRVLQVRNDIHNQGQGYHYKQSRPFNIERTPSLEDTKQFQIIFEELDSFLEESESATFYSRIRQELFAQKQYMEALVKLQQHSASWNLTSADEIEKNSHLWREIFNQLSLSATFKEIDISFSVDFRILASKRISESTQLILWIAYLLEPKTFAEKAPQSPFGFLSHTPKKKSSTSSLEFKIPNLTRKGTLNLSLEFPESLRDLLKWTFAGNLLTITKFSILHDRFDFYSVLNASAQHFGQVREWLRKIFVHMSEAPAKKMTNVSPSTYQSFTPTIADMESFLSISLIFWHLTVHSHKRIFQSRLRPPKLPSYFQHFWKQMIIAYGEESLAMQGLEQISKMERQKAQQMLHFLRGQSLHDSDKNIARIIYGHLALYYQTVSKDYGLWRSHESQLYYSLFEISTTEIQSMPQFKQTIFDCSLLTSKQLHEHDIFLSKSLALKNIAVLEKMSSPKGTTLSAASSPITSSTTPQSQYKRVQVRTPLLRPRSPSSIFRNINRSPVFQPVSGADELGLPQPGEVDEKELDALLERKVQQQLASGQSLDLDELTKLTDTLGGPSFSILDQARLSYSIGTKDRTISTTTGYSKMEEDTEAGSFYEALPLDISVQDMSHFIADGSDVEDEHSFGTYLEEKSALKLGDLSIPDDLPEIGNLQD